jgi:hypothetical protein
MSARMDVPGRAPYNEKIQSFGDANRSGLRTQKDH